VVRSNEKPCVCNVFATPHSKNPVKSSIPSYGMWIWKRTICKYTCIWFFLYIRHSIGMQEMTEKIRRIVEVISCRTQIICRVRNLAMTEKERSGIEVIDGFAENL